MLSRPLKRIKIGSSSCVARLRSYNVNRQNCKKADLPKSYLLVSTFEVLCRKGSSTFCMRHVYLLNTFLLSFFIMTKSSFIAHSHEKDFELGFGIIRLLLIKCKGLLKKMYNNRLKLSKYFMAL